MAILFAIIPVFLIILCGCLCRRFQFPDISFWREAEKITYFLLFPALLVSKMIEADLDDISFLRPVMVILLMYFIVSVCLILSKPFTQVSNAGFTSVYQGGIRLNTYIGLAVVAALYGGPGLVIAVVLASVMIPALNIYCVLVLECYSEQNGEGTVRRITKSILLNPLILACAIGMGINLLGIKLPSVLLETIDIFSRAALPLGLLTVGAALTLSSIKSSSKPIVMSSLIKFLCLPMVAMGLCALFTIDPMVRSVLLVLTVLPTAPASYVLARQLGGDYELMATIITAQTLLAAVFMPLMLVVLG